MEKQEVNNGTGNGWLVELPLSSERNVQLDVFVLGGTVKGEMGSVDIPTGKGLGTNAKHKRQCTLTGQTLQVADLFSLSFSASLPSLTHTHTHTHTHTLTNIHIQAHHRHACACAHTRRHAHTHTESCYIPWKPTSIIVECHNSGHKYCSHDQEHSVPPWHTRSKWLDNRLLLPFEEQNRRPITIPHYSLPSPRQELEEGTSLRDSRQRSCK